MRRIAIVLVTLLVASSTYAVPITWTASGWITSFEDSSSIDPRISALSVGDGISLSFTWDSDLFSEGMFAPVLQLDAFSLASATLGEGSIAVTHQFQPSQGTTGGSWELNYLYWADDPTFTVRNATGTDLTCVEPVSDVSACPRYTQAQLWSGSDEPAPGTFQFPPAPEAFLANTNRLMIFDTGYEYMDSLGVRRWSQQTVYGSVNSIVQRQDQPVQVPEPGCLALLSTGLIFMGVIRRRKRQASGHGAIF